ncbi:MAG: DNA-formamidopyrimidine glycosylase family protein [Actinomycetes bacterium]
MPEGDTVWRTAHQLAAVLTDQRLAAADLRVPAHATAHLAGWWVRGVRSRGKHILMDLAPGPGATDPVPGAPDATPTLALHTTLGMDGSWRVFAVGERWRGGRAFTIRATLSTDTHTTVGYSLPHVDLWRTPRETAELAHLGPDLLGPDWDPQLAIARLQADPARPLGDALLDQRCLAGVGNVYKSELCFLGGVHPASPVGEVPDLHAIVEQAHRLLLLNRASFTRVTTGDRRRPLWVYGRRGQPCRRCGTVVAGTQLGPPGRTRSTYWCPRCQPAPAVGAGLTTL